MSLIVLTDTFGTVDEMDSYFIKTLYSSDITSTPNKEGYLFQSYIKMNSFYDWNADAYYYFDQTIVPEYIKFGQFELVKNMITNNTFSSEPANPLTSFKAEGIKFDFAVDMNDKTNPLWTEDVKGLLYNWGEFKEPGITYLDVWG
jgi:hypothetical protein